ncbi:MAG: ABC transporter permease subunit, partial [Candidatus Thorarchaeota archaeon]
MEVVTSEKFEILKDLENERPPKDTKFIISLLTPGLAIFALIILVPIIIGLLLSFRIDFNLSNPFGSRFTILNFYQLLGYNNIHARDFWRYTYQTLFFSIVSLILEFILGLTFAMILNKKFKGRGIARATLLIPWAIPTIASATLFRFEILNSTEEFGLINGIIQYFGGQPVNFYGTGLAPILFNLPVLVSFPPFISEIPITMTMFSAIMIDVWKTTPFITLLILAALQIVPEDLYKAGDIAGASGWQKFRYITWPLIKPGVGIALIFRMMQALRVYDAIVVFNDQSVRSMTYHSFLYWANTDYGLSSAVSIMILIFVIIFAIFILIITRREKRTSSKPFLKDGFKRNKLKKKGFKNNNHEKKQILIENKRNETSFFKKNNINQDLMNLIGASVKLKPISPRKVSWYINKRRLKKYTFILLVISMCFFCAGPFIWIFLKSFRDPLTEPNIIQTEFEWFPKYLSLRAYQIIFQRENYFSNALLNSLILAGFTVITILIVGS